MVVLAGRLWVVMVVVLLAGCVWWGVDFGVLFR